MLTLHGYWRSGASHRVRIALGLKGLAFDQKPINLRNGAQRDPAYLSLNPQGLVPTLEADNARIIQSPAILEWLEETYPEPPLLPGTSEGRAVVRAMASVVACDIHPLNNLRVLQALRSDLAASEAQVEAWIARWIEAGFTALESLVAKHGRGFAFGSTPTLADCHLVPQVYSAERFNVSLAPFPSIKACKDRAEELTAFQRARPQAQPDAVSP